MLPIKKARTDGAAEHTVASSTAQPSTGTVQELPDTPDDVCTLRRLGSEMFEATLRSGEVWTGDAVLLKTFPQGEAKLATLTVREVVAASKATAKVEAKARGKAEEERRPEEGGEAKSAAKKPKSIREMLEAGASEHLKPVSHGTEGVSTDAGIVDKEAMGEPKTSKRRRIENVPAVEIGAGEHVVQKTAEATKSRPKP